MSPYQYAVVALCCLCNLADGFDVASLALVAPVLSKDWGIDPAVLGVIFTASSVGLAVGAFTIAPLADRFGRRPLMLGAIATLAVTMILSGLATSVTQLLVLRLIAGLGLGTLVVCLNTTVAEFSSDEKRNVSMAFLHVGFSLGSMSASAFTVVALTYLSWHSVFFAAGALNALTFVLSLFLLGESPRFLAKRRAPGDLERYNRLLGRMGVAPVDALPQQDAAAQGRGGFRAILDPVKRSETLLVWLTAFAYSIVGYFLMNWKPTIMANAGMSAQMAAASVLVSGVFGILGHLAMGVFARRAGERRLTAVFFLCAAVTLVIFGVMPAMPIPLILVASFTNFFVVGAYTGLFLVAVVMYPPATQNTGLGFIVGFVRVGAAIGPMIGGFLLSAGLGRMDVYAVFSAIALVPAVTMFLAMRIAARRPLAGTSPASAGPPRESASQAV